jgi:hypothetical protein
MNMGDPNMSRWTVVLMRESDMPIVVMIDETT